MKFGKPRITAVLGPTNTGKTHFAMERMLAHSSGMIGFPLRLLARENYDRAVAVKGAGKVALVTGEEKIIPAGAKYFLCTVESMPVERPVQFLGVDEIQLCADPERGHIFTDRLLNARGSGETMLMGAETIRPLIRLLAPGVEFISRPRFSVLSYGGERNITRLPPQSAIVAFSAGDVYAIAEMVRRHRGGAAIVMGALSPRARNAQIAMYQAGEVEYLVATDAIGMGLNMDVDHVAFAATSKFDGRRQRYLSAPELAQIAGRAGRHMNDGTFGVTAGGEAINADYIERIENHNFQTIKLARWRNPDPDQTTIATLQRSLAVAPPREGLVRGNRGGDELALSLLAGEADIRRLASHPAAVSLLWKVCQIPDFRNVLSDAHAELLGRIYTLLMADGAARKLPVDWVAGQVKRVERTDGDIETLTGRLANIRTWTYVANHGGDGDNWLHDPTHWRHRTRDIEDRLSDALHQRLTQRFVDRRTALLVKRLKTAGEMHAAVAADDTVTVEGHTIGRLSGLSFIADKAEPGGGAAAAGKSIAAAARRVLGREIMRRIDYLEAAPDSIIELCNDAALKWRCGTVGKLRRGREILEPEVSPVHDQHLPAAGRERLRRRLENWWRGRRGENLQPLIEIRDADLSGPSRGIAFQLCEGLGTLPRSKVREQIGALDRDQRRRLRKLGIVIGRQSVFMPAILKPAAIRLRGLLWSLWNGGEQLQAPPPGRVSTPLEGAPADFLNAVGYRPMGRLAIRADMLERLAAEAWALVKKGPFAISPGLLSLAGCGIEDMDAILKELGFGPTGPAGRERLYGLSRKARKRRNDGRDGAKDRKKRPGASRKAVYDPDSPFAKLRQLAPKK